MPLAARRVLDLLGRKMSLEAWRSLSPADRKLVVLAGTAARVDVEIAAVIARARPSPAPIPPLREPSAKTVPRELCEVLGASRPVTDERWRALGALDRYALVKSMRKPSKLARAYDEILGARVMLTHLTSTGAAHMIDVTRKATTERRAVATAIVRTHPEVVARVAAGEAPKGDVLAAARIAGILAAKRTPELVPLCHTVALTHVDIAFEADVDDGTIAVRATAEAFDRTGVEMEAMVAVSVASLTIYDMLKSADRWLVVERVRLEEKSGGKSGHVKRGARE
jgi:cyclic pyranopterin phosphate synthase